jgi:hypothetical protein
MSDYLPITDGVIIYFEPALKLVTSVKFFSRPDTARFQVGSPKPPAFSAEAAEVSPRISPTRFLPPKDRGEPTLVEQVVAGVVIAMNKPNLVRVRRINFGPTQSPFKSRPRSSNRVECESHSAHLLLSRTTERLSEEWKHVMRRDYLVNSGEFLAQYAAEYLAISA